MAQDFFLANYMSTNKIRYIYFDAENAMKRVIGCKVDILRLSAVINNKYCVDKYS